MTVQLDVQQAVFFCVRNLIRSWQIIRCGFRGQTGCKKLLMACHKLRIRDEHIIVGTYAVIFQWI